MTNKIRPFSISLIFINFGFIFLIIGIIASYLWLNSIYNWERHLNKAFHTGELLYGSIVNNKVPPDGIIIKEYIKPNSNEVSIKSLIQIYKKTQPNIITAVPLKDIYIFIVSNKIKYPISKLSNQSNNTPSKQLGEVIKLIANYCSDTVLFINNSKGNWKIIDGNSIWNCSAVPSDYRILSVFLILIPLGFLFSFAHEISQNFLRISKKLKKMSKSGKRNFLQENGPKELRSIIKTLNEYIILERQRLEQRIMILSMVSHDLGTPATRLKFRVASIEKEEIRSKLETDINKMTQMIESVLTYTRSELNSEEETTMSLTSFLSAIVSDYEDQGKQVYFNDNLTKQLDKGTSIFGGKRSKLNIIEEDTRRVLAKIRPLSLQRAIENLIENSLKYGRKAIVSLQYNSKFAYINIDDESISMDEKTLKELTGPFKRGPNASFIDGVGLGLTIVSTIAEQHGGKIFFEKTNIGLKTILKISRV